MTPSSSAVDRCSPTVVFGVFLRLGLTSFGGPIAHLGYFRREFVERRRWVTEAQYAQLLALCQFLPGPASSQMGFSLGLLRAGFAGALAAFAGFTLPSAILMFTFAMWLPTISGTVGVAAIHGLKLVAVAVVAHALISMARQLCPDWTRRGIAVSSAGLVLFWSIPAAQLAAIAFGAIAGLGLCRHAEDVRDTHLPLHYGRRVGWSLLAVFAATLLLLPALQRTADPLAQTMASFYRAGALVFGGGHVVLPLLKESVVDTGLISVDDFLAGYGAAQAVPGPMFTLAAYLGAVLPGDSGGLLGASVAILAIFLPGFLLIGGALPFWQALGTRPYAAGAMAGINAAVVGLLAAAFYDPVWISGIDDITDTLIAAAGLLLLLYRRLSALWVVLGCVAASLVRALVL